MRKKILILIPILLFLIALPVSLLLIKKQQDTRSRASTTDDIIFSFSPNDATTLKNKDISVNIMLNTQNKPVNTIEFKLTYDKDLLELKSTTNSTAFDSIFGDEKINNTTGIFYYAGTGNAHHDVTGTNIKITTLLFHTKTPTAQNTEAELGFTDLKAGAAGTINPITHATAFTPAKITVAQDNACDADTGRPLTCACAEDGQCESGGCDNNICVPSTPVETCESLPLRPAGCVCTEGEQCASNVCGEDSKCAAGDAPTATPTTTPTATPTPTTAVIPTATIFPTPTLIPGEKRFKVNISLPGIGTGENTTPIHPQRKAKIQVYNQNDELVKDLNSSLLIDTADSRYKAIVGLGTTFPNGPYLAKVKLSNSLSKQSSSILPISDSSTADTTTVVFNESLILGDINHDNELSILDYSLFLECTKNAICDASDEGQKFADLNDDGKVDAKDLNLLYIGFASRTGE